MTIDEVIDLAEKDTTQKLVILADSADSTNGGAVGDGIAVALRLVERGSNIRAGMYIKDPEAARQAFEIGVGNSDIMVSDAPKSSGDPQLLRHFGIEPTLYYLIVVKANTSFRAPYSKFAGEICYADTPGAGSSNLLSLQWHNIPKGFYPFDLPEGYQPEPAEIRSRH